MILYLFTFALLFLRMVSVEAADWNVVPQIRSANVTAAANQSFGAGPEKVEKKTLPEGSSLPLTLQANISDQSGKDRSAKGEIRLELEKGIARFKAKIEATDLNPSDFMAPIASAKGTVTMDLKVLLPDPSGQIKAKVRVSGEGPASLIGQEGKPLPTNVILQMWLNEEPLLQPEDFLWGAEKEIPSPLRHGDVLTLLFQSDFSLFSSGQADLVSTLNYIFFK
jgi:hypothetical protein